MTFLVALLVLSLGLTAALAYQAQDAARSHRATAERALHDYAAFAALEFAVNAKESIWNEMTAMLYRPSYFGSAHTSPRNAESRGGEAARTFDCPTTRADTTSFFFTMDLQTKQLRGTSGCASRAVQAWIADTIPPHALTYFKPSWDQAYIVCEVGGVPEMISYAVRRDAAMTPVIAYGFSVAFAPFAARVFEEIYKFYPLLPPALVGQTPNDSMLSVVVRDQSGYTLYRSDVSYPPTYNGSLTIDKYGGFSVDVSLRPSLADRLVIGGLPHSRLPLLVALLTLSAALVVAALLQLRREYELAGLRADFISSISHELRTPLAQVRMFAETLLLGRVRSDGERRRSLEIIDQEARRLTHLVENVLLFSRAERRVARLSPEPTELAGQVREAVEMFAPIALARKVTVATDLAENVVACVDRGALRQTLLNLLDNAVKYGPVGQTVTIRLDNGTGLARLAVEDQGPGVAPKERARIWQPFYRLQRDANSAIAGSGIGLAVVCELVAMHGGRAWVEDAPGGGARFVIEVPAASHNGEARVAATNGVEAAT